MAGCTTVKETLYPSLESVDDTLLVFDKSGNLTYIYDYDTVKTTGLEAAKIVFSLAALSCEEEISISRDLEITEEDMREAVSTLRFTPEYLCSTGTFSYTVSAPNEEDALYVTDLSLSYDYDTALIPQYRETLIATTAEIVNDLVTSDMPTFERALVLHDYLISTCEYDESYTHYSAYDALVNHIGTCQAYSQAYKLLLERVGISCDYASSTEMNHSWNMVNIDGIWYHVDVTWDDPVVVEGELDEIPHTFFLKSDATMEANEHYAWSADHEAPRDYQY